MGMRTIRQLKRLKQIKPDQDWALLTKKRILGSQAVRALETEKAGFLGSGFLQDLRFALNRHALAATVFTLAVIFLASGFMFLNYQNQSLKEIIVRLNLNSGDNSNAKLVASLEDIQASLENLNASLDNLKTLQDQNQALAVTEVVKVTAQKGAEAAANMKKNSSAAGAKVLASLEEIEQTSKELGEKSTVMQKELLENYIQDLKQRTLNDEDGNRLKTAEEYYKQGKEAEALVLLMRIGAR